ncbi:MAG: hypothetical protein ACK58L_15855 [Planctomycetota bacterium]
MSRFELPPKAMNGLLTERPAENHAAEDKSESADVLNEDRGAGYDTAC